MRHSRQAHGWLVAVAAMVSAAVCSLPAATATNVITPPRLLSVPASLMPPPMLQARSPVDFFRALLAMSPAERAASLSNRPPVIRQRILAKVREYQALSPDERELRLRATELRWYVVPLLHIAATNRADRLAAVPDELRPLVENRLRQWDILPPMLQQEFFESDRALRYFSHVDPPPPMPPLPSSREAPPNPADPEARWNSLSENQRQKITDQFNQFFELTPLEKKKMLNTLSEAERQQMEKTLAAFNQLPPAQRLKCVRAFTEFASMSPAEKQEFLNNARKWAQMSPQERQTWRDLVTHVPQWPPLPPALMPPLPPTIPPHLRPALATNHN